MINYIIYSLNLPCPPTFNSAEFYVSQLSIIPDKEAESYRKVFETKLIKSKNLQLVSIYEYLSNKIIHFMLY